MNDGAFSRDELQRLSQDEVVAAGWPEEADSRLRQVVDDLRQHAWLDVSASYNSYGSGYASFVPVFCTYADRRAQKALDQPVKMVEVYGLRLVLSRLGPYACVGEGRTTRRLDGVSSGEDLPSVDAVGIAPSDGNDWNDMLAAIREVLQRRGIALLDYDTLNEEIDWEVETILGDPPYRVFDAIFHWMD